MFNFFRKIRFNLLEQKKLGKYFRYASGELILIVLGIFIAIQIDGWNDKRIEQENLRSMLQAIDENIAQDLEAVGKIKQARLQMIEQSEFMFLLISQLDYEQQDILHIRNILIQSSTIKNYSTITSAYDALISSPVSQSLIKSDLSRLMHEYYDLAKQVSDSEKQYVDNIQAIQFFLNIFS